MNKPQKNTILIGLIAVAVMALFPPWERITEGGRIAVGYMLVFYASYSTASVAFARLAAQVLLVAAVCAALWLYLKTDS